MAEKSERAIKVVAENRKARFNYSIEDTVEAGLALTGTEVKSIRNGKTTIAESYADSRDGEIWLINANIPEYLQANRFNHEPKRPRKLLLHRKQINKLMPLHTNLFMESNPAPIKYAMSLLGKLEERLRLPMVPVSEPTRVAVRSAMVHAGLIN